MLGPIEIVESSRIIEDQPRIIYNNISSSDWIEIGIVLAIFLASYVAAVQIFLQPERQLNDIPLETARKCPIACERILSEGKVRIGGAQH